MKTGSLKAPGALRFWAAALHVIVSAQYQDSPDIILSAASVPGSRIPQLVNNPAYTATNGAAQTDPRQ